MVAATDADVDREKAAVRWFESSEKMGHCMRLVACGALHSLILCSTTPPSYEGGRVLKKRRDAPMTFGSNNAGQLGIGHRTMKNSPQMLDTLWHWDGIEKIVDVQSGARHSAAIVVQEGHREMWTWGQGWYGRLGHGNEEHRLKPKRIATFIFKRIEIASCSLGASHTVAISDKGDLYTWGMEQTWLRMCLMPTDEG